MAFTYVGQAVTWSNSFATGGSGTLPGSRASGDLLTMLLHTRGNITGALPSGWTTVYAVNNNNTTSGFPGRCNITVGYIVRGGSAPADGISGWAGSEAVRVVVKAFRPVSGTVSYLGFSSLDESTAPTAHDHAGISSLIADDLLCMEMASSGDYYYGAADAATDPATASAAPSGAHGTLTTTGMPSAGAWLNRAADGFTGGTTFAYYSADGVASATGSSGTLTCASSNISNFVGATMAFRASGGGGGGTVINPMSGRGAGAAQPIRSH